MRGPFLLLLSRNANSTARSSSPVGQLERARKIQAIFILISGVGHACLRVSIPK